LPSIGISISFELLCGWTISVLQGAGAIRECEEHGWMQDAPIRTRASVPSISPEIRRLAFLRKSRR
jgi:hypothetical protein